MSDHVPEGVDFLVSSFARKTPGVTHTLVVSVDGLLLAMSDQLDRATGDHLSAVASGLSSLTQGACRMFQAGKVEQVIVEMTAGYLFVSPISDGSLLSVLAERNCDIGMVGYEMALLVNKVGDVMTPASIAEVAAKLAVPLGVAKVLVADLAASGLLTIHRTVSNDGPDVTLLERLLDELRAC